MMDSVLFAPSQSTCPQSCDGKQVRLPVVSGLVLICEFIWLLMFLMAPQSSVLDDELKAQHPEPVKRGVYIVIS